MLKKINKTLKSLFMTSILIAPIGLTSCSSSGFYLANFESYMSPKLMDKIKRDYDVNFRSYSSNENLERSFTRNYDVAIPSTYLVAKLAEENKLVKINWEKFDLSYTDKNGIQKEIKTSDDALNLFQDDVRYILTEVYQINNKKVNLLDYGVPYFLQDLIFGYKNDISLDNEIKNENNPIGWENVLDYFGNQVGEGKKYNKIAMIDDYRSIFSIPRLIESKGGNVNPDVGEMYNIESRENKKQKNISIDKFVETYDILSKKTNGVKDAFLLNSDSGNILNDFVSGHWINNEFIFNGSDLGIMYNGDLLYSILGGDEYSGQSPTPFIDKNTGKMRAHFIRPHKTLMSLDMMVINKKTKNEHLAYNVIKKICLDGISDKTNVFDTNRDGEFIYGPMINFDYILYTSPLKDIYNYVTIGTNLNKENNEKYFDYLKDELKNDYTEESINNLISVAESIFKITTDPTPENMIEKDLSELNKSNMNYAFQKVKDRL